MDLELPKEEDLTELILELEREYGKALPEDLEISKEKLMLNVFKAIKRLFDEFPTEGYRPLTTYKEKGQEFQNQSSVYAVEGDDGYPYLNVRVFRDDGTWAFNGYVNIDKFTGYFAGISYNYLINFKRTDSSITQEKFEEYLVNIIVNVLRISIRRLPKWIELMIDSFESKIELIWGKYLYEDIKQENSLKGLQTPQIDLNAYRQRSIRSVESKIREFIQDDTGFDVYLLSRKKQNLALHYKNTYSHWKNIEDLQTKGSNWRRYVRAEDMSDITDDLIEDFEGGKQISDLALEQAARRAEIYNTGKLTKKNQKLRESGIMCSGYSRSKLFIFKGEGEKLLE